MSRLLHSGVRRYARSVLFWLAVVATVGLALYSGMLARQHCDGMYMVIEYVIYAILLSWLIGREYDEGIFRNKVIAGHTKSAIFVSEWILGVGACTILFLIYFTIFTACNGYIFSRFPAIVLVEIFVGFLLINIVVATIFVVLSSLISRRVIVGVVNIVLLYMLMWVGYTIENVIEAPEYYEVSDMQEELLYNENGESYWVTTSIPGTERQEKNQTYVGGVFREVLQRIYPAVPLGQLEEYMYIMNLYLGYGYVDIDGEFVEEQPPEFGTVEAGEYMKEAFGIEVVGTEEVAKIFRCYTLYSLGATAIIFALGYGAFRKKELK